MEVSSSGVGCPVMGNCKPFRITCLDIRNARWLPCRPTPYYQTLDSLITSVSLLKQDRSSCEKSIKLGRKKCRRHNRRRSRLTYLFDRNAEIRSSQSPPQQLKLSSYQLFVTSHTQDHRHYNVVLSTYMFYLIHNCHSFLIWYYGSRTKVGE